AQPLRLYRNTGREFAPVEEGAWPTLVGRALATADFDNDGGIDAVVTNLEGRPLLLRNVAVRGHWLGLALAGSRANRMALGARLEVQAGGRTQVFQVHTAASYMAACDPRVLVGLGTASTADRVTVRWPGGPITRLTRQPA